MREILATHKKLAQKLGKLEKNMMNEEILLQDSLL